MPLNKPAAAIPTRTSLPYQQHTPSLPRKRSRSPRRIPTPDLLFHIGVRANRTSHCRAKIGPMQASLRRTLTTNLRAPSSVVDHALICMLCVKRTQRSAAHTAVSPNSFPPINAALVPYHILQRYPPPPPPPRATCSTAHQYDRSVGYKTRCNAKCHAVKHRTVDCSVS